MIYARHRRFVATAAAVLLVWAAAVFAAPSMVQVDAPWPKPEQNATTSEPREPKNVALQRGLALAVADEAERMLPDTAAPAQRELLGVMLKEQANTFVSSYSVEGEVVTQEGPALRMLVDVNKRTLKETLTSMGLLQPRRRPVPYRLTLEGPDSAWSDIGRLQLLANVEPASDADLTLILRYRDEVWSGRLAQGNATDPAVTTLGVSSGETMEDVWWDVWSGYFGRGAELHAGPAANGVMLVVDGWFTADGLQAFDKMLAGWVGPAGDSALTDMTMETATVSGRWLVQSVDVSSLSSRLDRYVEGRGLTWRLENRTD